MKRPIAIGLSPNLEIDDIKLSFKSLFLGRVFFFNQDILNRLKKWFAANLGLKNTFTFNSGRSALFIGLKSLNLPKGSEVILQAFTCVAVPNSVIWAGLKPVFVDINRTDLGINIADLQKKISSKTKVIIVQHTFGIPAEIDTIVKIAKEKKIIVIEDCAHGIGVKYRNRYLGTFADLSVFSFGRDKAVSTVFGGLLSANNQKLLESVKTLYDHLKISSPFWVFKQYLHELLMFFILPLYNLGLGKLILYIFQKLKLLTPPVFPEEKQGEKPVCFPEKMHSAFAYLSLNQLGKLGRFNKRRVELVNLYSQRFSSETKVNYQNPLLRYPLLVKNRGELLLKAKRKGIILGNWYSHVIDPKGVNRRRVNYTTPCPTAEYVAQHIINLPTYPSLKTEEAKRIISFFNKGDLLRSS